MKGRAERGIETGLSDIARSTTKEETTHDIFLFLSYWVIIIKIIIKIFWVIELLKLLFLSYFLFLSSPFESIWVLVSVTST